MRQSESAEHDQGRNDRMRRRQCAGSTDLRIPSEDKLVVLVLEVKCVLLRVIFPLENFGDGHVVVEVVQVPFHIGQ
eukprot:1753715-Rhodomonas_salina.2